jgi:3-hydroxybutyrate dehydrogenase
MRLLGKVAVVTGAASGIGKEIARAFRREGAKVVIADLDRAGAEAAAEELGGKDKDAIGIAMDVTSEPEVEAGMAKAVSAFGRIDVLVSNAGIQIVGPIEDFDFAKWKLMLAIHLDGAFLSTR